MAQIHADLEATVAVLAAFAGVDDRRGPRITSTTTTDPRPLVSDPFRLGNDLDGADILDRLERNGSPEGWAAMARFIDAFCVNDIGAADLALSDARLWAASK